MIKHAIFNAAENTKGQVIVCTCSSAANSWQTCPIHKNGVIRASLGGKK